MVEFSPELLLFLSKNDTLSLKSYIVFSIFATFLGRFYILIKLAPKENPKFYIDMLLSVVIGYLLPTILLLS